MCNFPFFVKHGLSEPVEVPCGQCIECKLVKSKNWAIRILNETMFHDENCFVTLTYNDDNLPDNGSLIKSDLQKFIRSLRKKLGEKRIRYYGCGEYGEQHNRPHYHVIIFGHNFVTEEAIKENRAEIFKVSESKYRKYNIIYISKDLQEVWKKGFSTVGQVSLESAGYVARYTLKKINGIRAPDHYKGRIPEFALMSRRPGIGNEWFEKYYNDMYPKDFYTVNGIKHKPPRYYDTLLEKKNHNMLEEVKERRREKIKYEEPKRRRQREKYKKTITKSLERSL